MMVVFADTLLEIDLSILANEPAEAVAWVKPVPDPRRFGVAVIGQDGWVTRLIEKPEDMKNNLAVVGFYYFKDSESLISAIEEQMRQGLQLKGEYFLADAVNIMLERGLKMRTEKVNVWLDAGTPESLLETNRYLVDNGRNNSEEASKRETAVMIPPVYVHQTAVIENSLIGPFVSIAAGAFIRSSIVRDSILEDEAQVTDVILEDTLIGRQAQIQRRAGVINAGDHTVVVLTKDYPAAVLIRAVEPVRGIAQMKRYRNNGRLGNLASGPGKLCQAFAIDRSLNGQDVCGKVLYVEDRGEPRPKFDATPRIGVDYAGEWKEKPLRFAVRDSQFVSKR